MKKYIVFISVLLSFVTQKMYANDEIYFCGGWSYDPDYYYYNLFNQENISQKAFYPFLRTEESNFYGNVKLHESENIRLWYDFFNGENSIEVLTKVIYQKDEVVDVLKGDKRVAGIKYLKFAKSVEEVAVNDSKNYWDYDELMKVRKTTAPKLIGKGLKLFSEEKNKELKLRYGYQLIRLFRYSHQFTQALEFFNNEILPMQLKNEIFYYILDQVGGCYYKTKQYEKAAYVFLTVFDKSIDKKQSAFVSYKFCTYKKAEGKSLLKTREEKANQIFITALRSFSDTMGDLERILELGIAEDKQELLAIRIINNFERSILNIDFDKNIFQKREGVNNKLAQLQKFIIKKTQGNNNIEFWKLTDAYVSFLKENISEAKEKLKSINTKKFSKQKEDLALLFEVFSWDRITSEREIWLADLLSKRTKGLTVVGQCYYTKDTEQRISCSLKNIIVEQLSHLYLNEGKIAQSYLLHNYLKNVKEISSHKLVDDIARFVNKENKNSFEKLLLKDLTDNFSQKTIKEIVSNAKGAMYFRSGDIDNALQYLNPSEKKDIDPKVFSNNTVECFECHSDYVMEDEVYKADVFSFLNSKMNKYDLFSNLKKLEEMTNDQSIKQWKRKLANYLLGNYFFNVSNTGYYRTIVYPGQKYWYRYYFGSTRPDISEVIDEKKTYSFPSGGYANLYNGLADKAKEYYKRTIAMSTDNELNARCSYMIAKCELNDYYNNQSTTSRWSWDGYEGDEYKKHSTEGFEALKRKYRNTKFFQRIRSKCSFFRSYDAN